MNIIVPVLPDELLTRTPFIFNLPTFRATRRLYCTFHTQPLQVPKPYCKEGFELLLYLVAGARVTSSPDGTDSDSLLLENDGPLGSFPTDISFVIHETTSKMISQSRKKK